MWPLNNSAISPRVGDFLSRADGGLRRFGQQLRHEALALGDPLDFNRDGVNRFLEAPETFGGLRRHRRKGGTARSLPHHSRRADRKRTQNEDDERASERRRDLRI